MAMAPWFVQQKLLHDAVRKAALVLKRPIDRIEVTADKILIRADTKAPFWRRTKELTISYQYVADGSQSPGASLKWLLDGEKPARFDDIPRAGHAMLPPWREREELLHASISKGTTGLLAPIDRIAVTPDQILLGAGSAELAIAYRFVKSPGGRQKPRGVLLDGEDYWQCFESD